MTTQKPSVGRIVIVPKAALQPTDETNGADVVPAVITRVWSDNLVNVRVLLDGRDTPWKTSMALYETPEAYAEQAEAGRAFGCYWPPRV